VGFLWETNEIAFIEELQKANQLLKSTPKKGKNVTDIKGL